MASYHYHISRVSPVYLGPGPGGWHGDSLAAHTPALDFGFSTDTTHLTLPLGYFFDARPALCSYFH